MVVMIWGGTISTGRDPPEHVLAFGVLGTPPAENRENSSERALSCWSYSPRSEAPRPEDGLWGSEEKGVWCAPGLPTALTEDKCNLT